LLVCRSSKLDRPVTDVANNDNDLDTGNSILLEKADEFCYLRWHDGCRRTDSAVV